MCEEAEGAFEDGEEDVEEDAEPGDVGAEGFVGWASERMVLHLGRIAV